MLKIFSQKNKQSQKGFSLVEMLVAIAVFMSVMTIAISSLISIISANKKAQAIKSTVDAVNFAIETISRDMRVGYNYTCLSSLDGQKDCKDNGSTGVIYQSGPSIYTKYEFNKTDGTLTKEQCNSNSAGSCDSATISYLISADSNVKINNMIFYVIGADNELTPLARTQPKVMITVSGTIASNGNADTTFDLQTSFSQRMRQ